MTKRIFRSIMLAVVVALLASFVLAVWAVYQYARDEISSQLRTEISLAAAGTETAGETYLEGLDTSSYRVTWIDTDGTVLYDSSAGTETMENHLEREEVQEALRTGYGESRRYSSTLMERQIYVAQRLSDGTVLRMSMTQQSLLNVFLKTLGPMLLILAAAVALSLLLAHRLSKRIVKPLNEIDLDHPLENSGYDELAPLLRRIDAQQKELAERGAELARKQEELHTILENMSEGMILLRTNGSILGMNSAAAQLLDADENVIGRNILTVSRNLELQELISDALQGRYGERVIPLQAGKYQVSASPVKSGGELRGAAVVLFDVTEREEAEEMRREFSANVSHELKTPLHAISGYAELMKDGMAKPEDYVPFSEKIYKEAQRTIRLVEDIISLSHLDEGAEDLERENVDLYETAKSVADRLAPEAEKNHVILTVTGESAPMNGIPALLQTLIYNLTDNAIKYNNPGGSVTVDVRENAQNAVVTVADTGVGIPEADQKRIFERFYRVDKSRSRAIGGTGLGLSIVKHAALIHDGKIQLRSRVGEGTRITVTFPIRTP